MAFLKQKPGVLIGQRVIDDRYLEVPFPEQPEILEATDGCVAYRAPDGGTVTLTMTAIGEIRQVLERVRAASVRKKKKRAM